jgi:hypothetical protein
VLDRATGQVLLNQVPNFRASSICRGARQVLKLLRGAYFAIFLFLQVWNLQEVLG